MTNPIKTWRNQKKVRPLLGKKGKIITWTKIFVSAPEFKEQTPYFVALVQLENGEKIYGQVVEYHDEQSLIGREVESILRIVRKGNDENVIEYGLKFTLV